VNSHDLSELDPVAFVRTALAALPDDPADTTIEDLRVLRAVAGGLALRTTAITDAWRETAVRALEGRADARELDNCALLQILSSRCELARDELTTYTHAAVRARGFTPTGLARSLTKETQ